MDQLEHNEATLEKLIHSLREDIEQRTDAFTANDIAVFSGTIPYITTMLEYRNKRENFLNHLEKMKHSLKPHFFSDELIEKCQKLSDVSMESGQSLIKFFQEEVERVKSIRQKVLQNFSDLKLLADYQSVFEHFMFEISSALKQYRLAIARISSTTTMSYTLDDLLTMIRSMCRSHARKSYLKTMFLEFKSFTLTNRSQIVGNCFKLVEDDLFQSGKFTVPDVPFYITKVEELDKELIKVVSRFNVKESLDLEDGQLFLYHCDKKYTSIWNKIINSESVKVDPPDVGPKIGKSQYILIDEAIYKKSVNDDRLVQAMKIFFDDNERNITQYVKSMANGYNQMVGIKINRTLTSGLLKRKKTLPIDKLTCWFRMRYLYTRYLINAITANYNYFEAVKLNLFNKKYKWRTSPNFPQLIDVIDIETDKCVTFSTALNKFNDFKNTMTTIISHYTLQYETLMPEFQTKRSKIIDRCAMIEKFLEYELRYCNAKRSLVQNLYEFNSHKNSNDAIQQIYGIVNECPKYHVNLYTSFDYSYKLAIDIMEKRAFLVTTLYQCQILHERQISSQLPSSIPLFDRPIKINCDHFDRKFEESIPLSPFEIYRFLPYISRFLKLSEEIALDISQGIDFRDLQFFDYMHLSVLLQMQSALAKFASKGLFPFEVKSYPFSCDLSDSVFSLIVSPYVNNLHDIENLIFSIPESRQLRFCIAYIRFLQVSWKTQKLILKSDLLQKVYILQAALSSVGDPRVFVQSFSDISTQELIDVHEQFTNEKQLEFALIDFEAPEFNFNDRKLVSKYITEFDFVHLQRIHQFQKFHCFVLEVTTRYNNLYLDNEFLVQHFGLEEKIVTGEEEEDIDLFLTQADGVHQGETTNDNNEVFDNDNDNNNNNAFIRSFLAGTLLFDSQYIYENVKKANTKREYFFLNLRVQKSLTRTLINAQAKAKLYTDAELYNLYFTEMIEAFSAFAYRLEIANVCRLEKQCLLLNSFADAFIIEPTNIQLVNEAGRVQNHFIVPSWADTLFLVRTASLPRQASIFKIVLEHVTSLFQILNIVKFEVGLSQKVAKMFESIWENDFHLETATLQKLLNELNRLPGGNEFDVSSKYLESKLFLLVQRLELALFHTFESAFVSVSSGNTSLGEAALDLYQQLKAPLNYTKGIFNSHRFIPNWMNQFMGETLEINRSEILRQLATVDQRFDDILVGHQLHSVLESSQALIVSLDFAAIALMHERIKLCLFLLLDGRDMSAIDDPFVLMESKCFMAGLQEWNEKVVPDAFKTLVPKDDSIIASQDKPLPEDKILQAEIEIARNMCDDIILTIQLEEMKNISDLVTEHFSKPAIIINENVPDFSKRPLLENPSDIDSVFKSHLITCRFLLVRQLMEGIHEITAGDVIQMDHLESLLKNFSKVLSDFTDSSIRQLPESWHFIIKPYLDLVREGEENEILLSLFSKRMKNRFKYHLKAETATKLSEFLFEINKLEDSVTQRRRLIAPEDVDHESNIRADFERLLFDLSKQKQYLKTQFKLQRDSIYSLVLRRIDNAKNVKFERNPIGFVSKSLEVFTDETTVMKEDIDRLRVESQKMRIVRCISGIAAKRYYTKRIQSYESDRINERAKLWEAKRDFELLQTKMLNDLKTSYRTLANDEIEIERLKQQLENEKQATIQLVHWKALNTKKEEHFQKEIKKFTGVDKVNVGALLNKLSDAKDTLDNLNQETEYLEIETERDIRTPMRKAEKVRKKILTSKMQRSEALKTKSMGGRPQTAITINPNSMLNQYKEENIQLMSRNDHLMQQIEMLENTKEQMPKQTIAYMSEVVPAGRVTIQKEKGHPPRAKRSTITRPKTAMTPRKSGALESLLKTQLHT